MADYDAVLVGSGINSLACAAFLSLAGWRVAVLEREGELGGAVRTAPPSPASRSKTATRQPASERNAAHASELTPLPTRTAS